jgi:hypothetical protein
VAAARAALLAAHSLAGALLVALAAAHLLALPAALAALALLHALPALLLSAVTLLALVVGAALHGPLGLLSPELLALLRSLLPGHALLVALPAAHLLALPAAPAALALLHTLPALLLSATAALLQALTALLHALPALLTALLASTLLSTPAGLHPPAAPLAVLLPARLLAMPAALALLPTALLVTLQAALLSGLPAALAATLLLVAAMLPAAALLSSGLAALLTVLLSPSVALLSVLFALVLASTVVVCHGWSFGAGVVPAWYADLGAVADPSQARLALRIQIMPLTVHTNFHRKRRVTWEIGLFVPEDGRKRDVTGWRSSGPGSSRVPRGRDVPGVNQPDGPARCGTRLHPDAGSTAIPGSTDTGSGSSVTSPAGRYARRRDGRRLLCRLVRSLSSRTRELPDGYG